MGSATFTQSPAFAGPFSLTGAPSASLHYTVTSGTMPGAPSITAVLRKNGTPFATSNSVSASGGLLTFGFPSTPTSFVASDVISLVVTTNQAGVTFTLDYDSSTKPSKINLPTNTVIETDIVEVYDAPYPGGSVVTSSTLGQRLYVRVTASDPFGHADITSLPLVIDGAGTAGDVSTTLTNANAVSTTAATKTYQYVWTTGATEGNFTITATAKEGFENTISSSKSTVVTLSGLDLGTPSIAAFTTGSNGSTTTTFAANEQVAVRVTDIDQNVNATVAETLPATITSSSGDSELVTLTETGINTGVFVLGIPASASVAGSQQQWNAVCPGGCCFDPVVCGSHEPF